MCKTSVCEVAELQQCQCSSAQETCKLCCTNDTSQAEYCRPAVEHSRFIEENILVAKWLEPGVLI